MSLRQRKLHQRSTCKIKQEKLRVDISGPALQYSKNAVE